MQHNFIRSCMDTLQKSFEYFFAWYGSLLKNVCSSLLKQKSGDISTFTSIKLKLGEISKQICDEIYYVPDVGQYF